MRSRPIVATIVSVVITYWLGEPEGNPDDSLYHSILVVGRDPSNVRYKIVATKFKGHSTRSRHSLQETLPVDDKGPLNHKELILKNIVSVGVRINNRKGHKWNGLGKE